MINLKMKLFEGKNKNVSKYVFQNEEIVAETVLYKYGDYMERTVICCSTQSGCPVGCKFCGTGNKFIRNLTAEEIIYQVTEALKDKEILSKVNNCKKFQIMFMSMGEPFLNYYEVETAIIELNKLFPNADLLISTIMPNVSDEIKARFVLLSTAIEKVGLQFSIHKSNNVERNELIPFKNKCTLQEIRDYGLFWWKETGRKPYLNYCIDGWNDRTNDCVALSNLFSPVAFNFTFSVVCSKYETMQNAGFRNLDAIRAFEQYFLEKGYNTRIFDPDGQDDIGGGCGQLWFVQQYFKDKGLK